MCDPGLNVGPEKRDSLLEQFAKFELGMGLR